MSHGPLAAYSAYANDINIHSDTWGEHVQQVPTVTRRSFEVEWKKVQYLG